MSTTIEVLDPKADGLPIPSNDRILKSVETMEKISTIVPLVILAAVFGVPTLMSLFQGSLMSVLINGVIWFLIAGLVIKIVEKAILHPIRHVRFKAAAQTLQAQAQSLPEPLSLWRSWFLLAPGALAITRRGHVVLIDRSTNYDHLWLAREQIVNVSVEREVTHITNTSRSSSFTLGNVFGGGFFSGITFGGSSRSVTHKIETAFLEIRYQFERNGAVYTSAIPFGENRRGADELRAAIMCLEPVT